MRTNLRLVTLLLSLMAALALCGARASAQTITKIIDNGPDARRLTIAVVSEGYTEQEMPAFRDDVDRIVKEGVFTHDEYFEERRRAFNVYRVEMPSQDSGVSQRRPGQTPVERNTFLRTAFTGDPRSEHGPYILAPQNPSQDILFNTLKEKPEFILFPTFVVVLLNENEYGGVTYNNRLIFMTKGSRWPQEDENSGWRILSHELGHCVSGLYDEYGSFSGASYSGPSVARVNCATDLNGARVQWSRFITPGFQIPPDSSLLGADPQAIGMFKGCNGFNERIYRPAPNCRMRDLSVPFCKICRSLMDGEIDRILGQAPATPTGLEAVVAAPPTAAALPAVAFQADDSRVNMLIRFTKEGAFEVLQATQVPNLIAQKSTWTSDFAYEITGPTGTLFADDLIADPFVVRGFPDPDGHGHSITAAKSAVALVRIPNVTAADILGGRVGLRLYKVKSETTATAATVELNDINLDTIDRLKGRKLLEKQVDYSPRRLSEKIRQFGSLDRQ